MNIKKLQTISLIYGIFLFYFGGESYCYDIWSNIKYYTNRENINYGLNLAGSVATLYPSFVYNWVRYGKSYTFDTVIPRGNSKTAGDFRVIRDSHGGITSIDDGKRLPVLISGIPFQQEHLDTIKTALLSPTFTIYSFNLDFERRWFNWRWLSLDGIAIKLYPTVDHGAPNKVDLIRIVIDLFHRTKPALVQCKAGHGRSATGIGAYLMTIAFLAHDQATVDDIEAYLKSIRPRAGFGHSQRQALIEFRRELESRSHNTQALISSLKESFKDQIAIREEEIRKTFRHYGETEDHQ